MFYEAKLAPRLLDTYNEERVQVAERLLEMDRMFDLLVNPAWLLSFVHRQIFPQVANFIVGLDSVNQFIFSNSRSEHQER